MIREHELIRGFLSAVCAEIRARDVHREIRQELVTHLEELVEQREKTGASRDEAVRYAVGQMGDPAAIGKQLHSIHRPKTNWVLLIGVFLFAAIGVLVLYAVQGSWQGTTGINDSLFEKKMVSVCIGFVLMIALYFFDYRKLRHYSWAIYIVALGGLLLCYGVGVQRGGSRSYLDIGSFSVDWVWFGTYLFVIAAAGILLDRQRKPYFWPIVSLVLLLVPCLFIAGLSRTTSLLLYTVTLATMTGVLTRDWLRTVLHIVVPAVLAAVWLLVSNHSRLERLGAFLDPAGDPRGSGYMYVHAERALQAAGWYGTGFAHPLPLLPNIYSDMVYVYWVYSMGWLAGIALVAAFAVFVGWLVRSALQVRETYGKTMMTGIAVIVSFQIGYYLLMSLGLAPLLAFPLPFVSHGLTHVLAEMAALGLALAIYRRKQLVSGVRTRG